MRIHELQRNTKQASKKRVGRGGLRGKTSGRGHKGQKARAGNKARPEMRDIIKRLPKRRGHGKNRARTVNSGKVRPEVVNLAMLEMLFGNGDAVNPESLCETRAIRRKGGALPKVKVLGNGDLTKKLSVTGCEFSASAQAKIEKAGGTIEK